MALYDRDQSWWRFFTPRKARHYTWREQMGFVLIGLATVFEGLVIALSFGFLTVDARIYVLFEAWDDE